MEEDLVIEEGLLEDQLRQDRLASGEKSPPRKFTLHCTVFLMALLVVTLCTRWLWLRFVRSQKTETQLDLMMKRQILESAVFRNSTLHYENNFAVQYANDEQYMAVMLAKEQQRLELKARMEKERFERMERKWTTLRPAVIPERSKESTSLASSGETSLLT